MLHGCDLSGALRSIKQRLQYTNRKIAVRCHGDIDALKMGCIGNRVVYTRHVIAGHHNDVPPEMIPAPILWCQLSNITRETDCSNGYVMVTLRLVV